MKKLLAVLPLVAGASWAGTTYYSGSQTRDAYDQLLTQLNQITNFSVANESYTAGFKASEKLTELFGDQEPAVLISKIGFNGKTLNELRTAAIDVDSEEGKLKVSESIHKFDLDLEGKFTGTGEFGEISFTNSEGFTMSMPSGTQAYDLDWVQAGVFTGESKMNIEKISFNSSNGVGVDLNGVSLDYTSTATDGTLGYDAIMAVADVQSPIDILSAKLTHSLSGLNMDAITEAQDFSNKLLLDDPEALDSAEVLSSLGTIYKSMITKGASIGYGLGFTNEGGAAESDFNLTFKGDDSDTGMDNLETVGDLVNALQASLTIEADAAALESTPLAMALYSPQASQVLVEENGKYTANIALNDSVVDINGQPLSLALMFAEPLQMPLDPSLLMMMSR